MNCGCNNSYYPFPKSCCSSSSQVTGPYPCQPHLPCLLKNLTTPASGSVVTAYFTSTVNLYQGQGIAIGDNYFFIQEIADSTTAILIHYGTVTVGQTFVAVHPVYGCYQYPIIPCGIVKIENTPNLAGLTNDRETVVALSVVGSPTINKLKYGYLGPKTIQFDAEVVVETDNTPAFLAIELPVTPSILNPLLVASAAFDDGSNLEPAIAVLGVGAYDGFVLIGPGGASVIADRADNLFRVSGTYDL